MTLVHYSYFFICVTISVVSGLLTSREDFGEKFGDSPLPKGRDSWLGSRVIWPSGLVFQ